MNTNLMNHDILTRLNEMIAHHEKWGSKDFAISQWILWIAILSSFAATILVGKQQIDSLLLAVIAGLPALMLMIDKTFRFRDRAKWHELYSLRVSEIRDAHQLGEMDANEAAKKTAKLRAELHHKWPGENVSSIPSAPSEPTIHSDGK
jgi:hypothetical protein